MRLLVIIRCKTKDTITVPYDIWNDLAKVYRNGLKKLKARLSARDFGLGGVYRSDWWASLFGLFDTADNVTIGGWKCTIRKNCRVLPDSMSFAK